MTDDLLVLVAVAVAGAGLVMLLRWWHYRDDREFYDKLKDLD